MVMVNTGNLAKALDCGALWFLKRFTNQHQVLSFWHGKEKRTIACNSRYFVLFYRDRINDLLLLAHELVSFGCYGQLGDDIYHSIITGNVFNQEALTHRARAIDKAEGGPPMCTPDNWAQKKAVRALLKEAINERVRDAEKISKANRALRSFLGNGNFEQLSHSSQRQEAPVRATALTR